MAAGWAYEPSARKVWKSLGHEHPYGEDASWPKNMKVGAPLDPDFAKTLPDLILDDILDATIIYGSPDRVIRRLEPFVQAGLTELSFLNMTPWIDVRRGPEFPKLASEIITGLGGNPLNLEA